MSENSSSSMTQIVMTVITVLGSLGVAYLTTGAKFASELSSNQAAVQQLKTELQSVKNDTGKQVADMKALLISATGQNKELQTQIAALKTQIESATKKTEEVKVATTNADTRLKAIYAIRPEILKSMPIQPNTKNLVTPRQ